MKIIGVAGESGTGKTTIAHHLRDKYDGVHIDADQVGHQILCDDRDVIDAVVALVGAGVVDADGRIDRRRLGAVVFADSELLRSYNAIVHPVIRARCGEMVAAARDDGARLVVVDAALLLDSKMPFAFDLMVALRCSAADQLERLIARGGWSEAQVRARLVNQKNIEKSFYKADVVVDTSGALETVLARIDGLVTNLLSDDITKE